MSGCKSTFIARLQDGIARRALRFLKRDLVFSNEHFKVLMFHDIDRDGDYSASFNDFCKIVNELLLRGYEFVNVDKLIESKSSKALRKKVLITFDDGFESTYSIAYPFLKEKGIPFCVFVTTSYVNKPGYINREQLRILSEDPICSIGSHFVNHVMSRYVNKKTIINEVTESFEHLNAWCSLRSRIIALPYGSNYSCSKKDFRLIYKLGAACVFTTSPSYVKRIKLSAVPRIDGSKILEREKI